MSDWDDVRTWTGDGLRREVLYVRSGESDVFVSLSGPAERRASFGFLVCPAWGLEGTGSRDLPIALARAAAKRGGLGVTFDYPGHDDSTGDVETATIDVMTRAAVDCGHEVRDRFEGRWILVGIRLGASVAALASKELEPSRMLFVDEALDPAAYFDGLVRRSRRARLAYPGSSGLAFGVPLSEPVLRTSAGRAAEVRAAVSAVGEVTSVRYASMAHDSTDLDMASVVVEGRANLWLRRSLHQPVAAAAAQWLDGVAVPGS
jgi:pimeloyl-ACP methyl ester carboxylesterase